MKWHNFKLLIHDKVLTEMGVDNACEVDACVDITQVVAIHKVSEDKVALMMFNTDIIEVVGTYDEVKQAVCR